MEGFILPNSSLKNDNTIYVIDANDRLKIKKIEVVGTDEDNVIVKGEINLNERIIVSTLNSGYEGMLLTPMMLEKNEKE